MKRIAHAGRDRRLLAGGRTRPLVRRRRGLRPNLPRALPADLRGRGAGRTRRLAGLARGRPGAGAAPRPVLQKHVPGVPRIYENGSGCPRRGRAGHRQGFDTRVDPLFRQFFYLPFMHSEDPLHRRAPSASTRRSGIPSSLQWARHHHDIVARFGRFPHRNALLGRRITPEEEAFLATTRLQRDGGAGRDPLRPGRITRPCVEQCGRPLRVMPKCPSAPRPMAATPVRETSTRPTATIRPMKRSTSSVVPGQLEDEGGQSVASTVRAPKAEASRIASTRCSPLPSTFTSASSRSIALPWTVRSTHAVDRDQPLELALDLLQDRVRAGRHDGDAREVLLVLGLRDREALDVVAAAGEQPRDAREHARLVVDDTASVWRVDRLDERSGRGNACSWRSFGRLRRSAADALADRAIDRRGGSSSTSSSSSEPGLLQRGLAPLAEGRQGRGSASM